MTVSRTRRGLGAPGAGALIRRAVTATLKAENVLETCRVDVMLTDDETIRRLNRKYRDRDSATDVLSFPMNELKPGYFSAESCERDMDTGELLLGDMVINIPRCAAQGEEYGHGFKRELAYLAVHSTLHLLGYDHVDEGQEKQLMRTREDAVMRRLGISRGEREEETK